jgi:hypothetical protein
MSKERLQRYNKLGQGTENLTLGPKSDQEIVIKLARELYIFNKTDHLATKKRTKENLETIHQYIDGEFLPETKIKSLGKFWWTQQKKIASN